MSLRLTSGVYGFGLSSNQLSCNGYEVRRLLVDGELVLTSRQIYIGSGRFYNSAPGNITSQFITPTNNRYALLNPSFSPRMTTVTQNTNNSPSIWRWDNGTGYDNYRIDTGLGPRLMDWADTGAGLWLDVTVRADGWNRAIMQSVYDIGGGHFVLNLYPTMLHFYIREDNWMEVDWRYHNGTSPTSTSYGYGDNLEYVDGEFLLFHNDMEDYL